MANDKLIDTVLADMGIAMPASTLAFDAAAGKFGSFTTDNGTTVAATQTAYAENLAGEACGYAYMAAAIDADGNDYRITWSVTNADAENDEDQCDWSVYTVTAR